MTNSTELSAEQICLAQSTVISFPAVTIISSVKTGVINSIGHFAACEIRQRSNAAMAAEDNYNIYNKTGVGAVAGIVKYTFNHQFTPTGITKTTFATGAINNALYHLEPEITQAINYTAGETAASWYPYISPILIEAFEGALIYELGNAGKSYSNRFYDIWS